MFKGVLKSSFVVLLAASLVFPVQASAEEEIDGKCSITIDASKHLAKTDNNRAVATGKCGERVTGYYGAGNFHVIGLYDGIVVDGEKFNILVMPGFYTYEVTVHTVKEVQSLEAPTVNSVNTSNKKVTGVTEPNLKVVVKSGKTTLGSAKSDKNGKYSIALKKAQKVGTKLTVTVSKLKENKSKSVVVKYVSPKVSTVKSTATSIKGTTIAGAKVTVKAGSKTLGTATANSKGAFTVKIAKQKANTKLSVYATKSKNSSQTTTITVKK